MAKAKKNDAESKFWDRDAIVKNFLEHANNLDEAAVTVTRAAKAFKLLAEGRIRAILPTVDAMMKEAEDVDIVNTLAVGLLHMVTVPQPSDAALNHHAAFGVWVTDWIHLELALATWDTKFGPAHPFTFAVRVHLSVRDVFSPCEKGDNLLSFPPDASNAKLVSWVKAAAKATGFTGPVDVWGGGSWISLVITGPVHRSYQNAADLARSVSLHTSNWDNVIPPNGWI